MLLFFLCLTVALAQKGAFPRVNWNVSRLHEQSPHDRHYDAFSYNKDTPAKLLLASKINFESSPTSPFPAQNIFAINPDNGLILWQSVGELQICAWNNFQLLTVFGSRYNNIQAIEPITKRVLWTTNYTSESPFSLTGCALSNSGASFAIITDDATSVVSFASSDGSFLWATQLSGEVMTRLVACGADDFCVRSNGQINYISAQKGQILWSVPGQIASRGSSDSILVGDGTSKTPRSFVLVNAASGNIQWNMTLCSHCYAYDAAIHGDKAFIVYMNTQTKRDSQNVFPYALGGFSLSDGKQIYETGPTGPTLGWPSFFKNGDFAMLGSGSIGQFDSQTGKNKCNLWPIQDYGITTRPGIDDENNRFFAVSYTSGWKHQELLSLSC